MLVFLLAAAPLARAAELPLSYGGRLTDGAGKPVTGPVKLQLEFFRQATGGEPVLAAPRTYAGTALSEGVFQVTLGLSPADLQTVFPDPATPVFVQVTDATHGVTYPRQRFLMVPYALKVPVDGTSVVYDGSGALSVGHVDAAKVTGLAAFVAGMNTGVNRGGDTMSGNLGIGTTSAQTALDVAGVLTQRAAGAPGVAPAGEGRIYFDASSNQFLVSQNGGAYAPLGTVTGGTITQVSAGGGLTGGGTTGNVTVGMPSVGTPGTYTKVLTDAYGRVTAGSTLTAADLPAVPVTQLTGTLTAAQITTIPVTQLAGTLGAAQLPSLPVSQLSGTLTAAQLPSLSGAQITSGTLSVALGGTGATSFPAGGVVVGAGSLPLSTVAAASQYQVLQQGASGPAFGPLDLGRAAAVTGTLASAQVNWAAPGALGAQTPSSGSFTTLSTSGNVGLGTPTPTQQLQLTGNILLPLATGNGAGNLFFNGDTSVSANGLRIFDNEAAAGAYLDVRTASATNGLIFRVDSANGGTERVRINAAGNVGIGTNSPADKLEVSGNIRISGSGHGVTYPDGTTQTTAFAASTTQIFYDCTNANSNDSTNTPCFQAAQDGGHGTATYRALFCDSTGVASLSGIFTTFVGTPGSGGIWRYRDHDGNNYDCSNGAVVARFDATGGAYTTQWSDASGGINYASGNVAIGSTSARNPLWVHTGTDKNFGVRSGTIDVTAARIQAYDDAGGTAVPLEIAGSRFDFVGGNVGIGTITPSSALTVNGTIESKTGGLKLPDGTTQTTAYPGVVVSRAQLSANTVPATGDLIYDVKSIDTATAYTTANGRFTAPTTGYYQVTVAAHVTAVVVLELWKNNAYYSRLLQGANVGIESGTDVILLNAGDYITIHNAAGSAASLQNCPGPTCNYFNVIRIN